LLKQNTKTIAVFVVALLLLLIGSVVEANQASEKTKQLALLRQKMQVIEKNIKSTQQLKSKEEKALRKIEKKLSQTGKKLRALTGDLKRSKKKIESLKQQRKQFKKTIDGQKGLLAEQLRSAYMMGHQQKIKLLLNQENPERLSRVMQYYDFFNQARVDNVKVLEKSVLELNKVEQQLEKEQHHLVGVVQAIQVENRELLAAKKTRNIVVAKLHADIQVSGKALSTLKQDEKRLASLLASIHQAIDDIPVLDHKNKPFPKLKGKLAWPVKGRLLKKFGSAKKAGRLDGVLIAAREGSMVRSVSHGRVVFADWLRGYGLLLIVDHGEKYLSLYAFNENLYKEVGDWVSAGESIATVGMSGGQQKAGLYFSIRKNGKPVNPIRWCRAVKNGRVG